MTEPDDITGLDPETEDKPVAHSTHKRTQRALIIAISAGLLAVGGVFLVVLFLPGGGTSADDLARQACGKYNPALDSAGQTSLTDYDNQTAEANKAADLAARAARADSVWDTLADAISREADIFARGRSAFSAQEANNLTPADGDLLRSLVTEARGYEATIRAECRKAKP